MKVRCIASLPTLPESRRLGARYSPGSQAFPVEVGQEYLVFGIETYAEGAWLYIETEVGLLTSVPVVLFEPIDTAIPVDWHVQPTPEGHLTIGPEVILDKHFLDDLSEGVPTAVRHFQRLKQSLT